MEPGIRLVIRALGEWGQREIPGPKHNPRIGEYLASVGLPPSDEISWCSAFLHWCAAQEGLDRPPVRAAPAARSWLHVGMPVTSPMLGDVVVLTRGNPGGWTGHVGLYLADSGGVVHVLGGNQGNEVNASTYPVARVLGYRRLTPE